MHHRCGISTIDDAAPAVLRVTSTPGAAAAFRVAVPVGQTRVVSSAERPPVIRVGCPMWAHPPWVGRFLSPGRRGQELAEYATWCNAVEGNTTFYAIPAATTIARWAEQAPEDFRFAFKAPRTVTHDRRLRPEAHRDLAEFLRAIEPLGGRVGPVQLQLPPSFGPEHVRTLADFVTRLPTSHRWVVELRHRSFFDGGRVHREIDAVLADVGVGRVVLDTRPLYSVDEQTDAAVDERRSKPKLPVVTEVMGDEPIVRVIGADDADSTFDGLSAWIPTLAGWVADGRQPYLFVHQPENRESPAIARRIHAELSKAVGDLQPLPTPSPIVGARGDDQSSLF